MLTYSRMASYLRFTSSSPRILRETTTGRARRAGLPRVRRRREPNARTPVAQRDARSVPLGREGERREAHGRPVGHGARTRRRLDEGRRAQSAGRGHPALSEPCRLPYGRGPIVGAGAGEPAELPRRAAARQRLQRRAADRPRARQERYVARARRPPGHRGQSGGRLQAVVARNDPPSGGVRFTQSARAGFRRSFAMAESDAPAPRPAGPVAIRRAGARRPATLEALGGVG